MPPKLGDSRHAEEWETLKNLSARWSDPASPADALRRARWLFLSASVPLDHDDPERRQREAKVVATARPKMIQETVVALVKKLAGSDTGLVFGGHPTITPALAGPVLETRTAEPWVVIVQAEVFRYRFIEEVGVLQAMDGVVCVMQPDGKKALGDMREGMARLPGMIGAVFLGGLSGIRDEFDTFGRVQPGLPRLALGLGGGQAAELLLDPETEAAAMGEVKGAEDSQTKAPIKQPGRLWHTPEAAVDAICEHFDIKMKP